MGGLGVLLRAIMGGPWFHMHKLLMISGGCVCCTLTDTVFSGFGMDMAASVYLAGIDEFGLRDGRLLHKGDKWGRRYRW